MREGGSPRHLTPALARRIDRRNESLLDSAINPPSRVGTPDHIKEGSMSHDSPWGVVVAGGSL
jgi:hypothetical protein